jgi:DNA gyrase subunit A
MGLSEIIRLVVEHRRDVVQRRTRFDLRKAREREHILTGYQVALDHLDEVIRIIRGSSGRAEAKENLLKFFSEEHVTITEGGKSKKIEGVTLDGRK